MPLDDRKEWELASLQLIVEGFKHGHTDGAGVLDGVRNLFGAGGYQPDTQRLVHDLTQMRAASPAAVAQPAQQKQARK